MEVKAIDQSWPELPPFATWEESHTTLLLWTQIVGKIRMEYTPFINHYWGATLYVTTRGVTTSLIPYLDGGFAIDFDFIDHRLNILTTQGDARSFPLLSMTVAEFYAKILAALKELSISVSIHARPNEVVDAIPFALDVEHRHYDPEAVHHYWTVLVRVSHVFTEFRARFIGKVSPVQLFWGAMDLAVTRFSGRTAPKHPGGIPNCPDWVMEESYSHEVSSAGFWAGAGLGEAAFYSYAYPAPAGFNQWRVETEGAYFSESLGEFVLPYSAIQPSKPREKLLSFLQSTYEGAAHLSQWDRQALERRA
jgi:hypothetical protein